MIGPWWSAVFNKYGKNTCGKAAVQLLASFSSVINCDWVQFLVDVNVDRCFGYFRRSRVLINPSGRFRFCHKVRFCMSIWYDTIWHYEWFALENWQANCQNLVRKLKELKLFWMELKWQKWNKYCCVKRRKNPEADGCRREKPEIRKLKRTEITRTETRKPEAEKNAIKESVSSPDICEISQKGARCLWRVAFEKEKKVFLRLWNIFVHVSHWVTDF